MKLADVKNGVVENVIEVDPDNIPDWAADWPKITEGGIGWTYDGADFSPPPPPPVTQQDVDRERDRRLNGTFTFNGYTFQFGPESKTRIAGAGTLAGFAIANGAVEGDVYWNDPTGTEPFTWIAADNTFVQMDAQTCFAFAQTAAKYESKLIFAARALKDVAEIPADYADDKYWP